MVLVILVLVILVLVVLVLVLLLLLLLLLYLDKRTREEGNSPLEGRHTEETQTLYPIVHPVVDPGSRGLSYMKVQEH